MRRTVALAVSCIAVITFCLGIIACSDPNLEALISTFRLLVKCGYPARDMCNAAIVGMLEATGDTYGRLIVDPVPSSTASSGLLTERYPLFHYIRIGGFSVRTASEFEKAISHVEDQDNLVVDLQGCPGGDLGAAIKIAQFLCSKEEPMITVQTLDGQKATYAGQGSCQPSRLFVLIDSFTASSAELVAASLKSASTAILVGTPTYGKDTVQTTMPLPNGSVLDVTTGFFAYPDGRRVGSIEPDVTVDAPVTPEGLIELLCDW